MASGLPADEFHFLGFLPEKAGARRTRIEELTAAGTQGTLVFYEAPHRILDALADLEAVFGPHLRVVVARELTKVHEEFLRGTVAGVRAELARRDRVRGEITLLVRVPAVDAARAASAGPVQNIAQSVARLEAEEGIDEKEALKRLARQLGRSKSELYRELQRERAGAQRRK